MTGIWTFPWTLYEEGLADACDDLAARGVDELVVASHHHSARVLQPRLPDALFDERPGGCYFEPTPERFSDTPIRPIRNDVGDADDPLSEIVAVADDHGLRTNAWVVCFHNSRLGSEYPDYRIEDAFGNAHDHAFCPSHPEVRQYFAGVAADVAARGVDAVELEKVRYPTVFHGHGTTFGHDERQVLTTNTEERLFSQCFCEACRREARTHTVDFDRAQAVVQDIVEESFRNPDSSPMPLGDLVHEKPVLGDLFRFRAAVVEAQLERIAAAAGETDVTAYVRQVGPDWSAGVTLDAIERQVDRVTALCYVSDPSEASDRVRTLRRSTDLPVDVGVTLDPPVVERAADLDALVEAIRAETDGRVTVYNHAMMTETHLDWVEDLVV